MKKNIFNILGVGIGFLPLLVFAQSTNAGAAFLSNWTKLLHFVISSLFPILISLAGVIFMVQVIRFIVTQDTDKRTEYRKSIIWNLGILLVLLTFFGLIKLVTTVFGLQIGTDISALGTSGTSCNRETVRGIIMCVLKFISSTMIPTAFSIATLTFMWNLVVYLTKTDNESERTKARNYMMWALISLAVMLTMFSIINIGTQTLFGSGSFIPQFPTK